MDQPIYLCLSSGVIERRSRLLPSLSLKLGNTLAGGTNRIAPKANKKNSRFSLGNPLESEIVCKETQIERDRLGLILPWTDILGKHRETARFRKLEMIPWSRCVFLSKSTFLCISV
jgi:hypothetical protein